MREELLQALRTITSEEQKILHGEKDIEKDLYMSSNSNEIDAAKLLERGKLIQVRPHTRFVHFPKHTHNYVEVIYMCTGNTHHVVNGHHIELNCGELLFLNPKAVQEIYPASEEDLAVNFIILPEFFEYGLKMISTEQNMLRAFVIDSIQGKNGSSGYLHFKVGDILPIQNLIENLIWTLWNKQPNKRSTNQITMGLLLIQLLNHMDSIETDIGNKEHQLVIEVLSYIEEHYLDGELSELASWLHYDLYWLSRQIKKQTGKTYTDLLQQKRLAQAAYLLQHTGMSVLDVATSVGYANISYFHRIFKKHFGMTPRHYRQNSK